MTGSSSLSNGAVVALAVVAAGLIVYPGPAADFMRHHAGASEEKPKSLWETVKPGSGAAAVAADERTSVWDSFRPVQFLHISAFATAFGASLWVSFIGGVIMFQHLPRHQFGNLQSHMFPAFFRLTAVMITTNLAIFATLHPWGSSTAWERVQVGTLSMSLVLTLINLLVLEPITTKLMRQRHKAEREEEIPTEPGVSRNKEIENAGPKLKEINKKFGAMHGISSLLNLFSFWFHAAHGVYMAGKLAL